MGFPTVKRHLCDSRLSLSNESLDNLLRVRINAPLLQKLDPSYETKLVSKTVELYMNSPQRGSYMNTTTRYSVVEVASAQEKSSDLFLPVSSAASITVTEPKNELLGNDEFVGNISDSGESDGDSGSDSLSEEESDML